MQTEISSGPAFAFGEIKLPPGSSVRVEAGAMAMTRGDVGTLERHLDALARLAPGVLPLYRAAAEREIELAESRGSLAPHAAESMRRLLAMPV